MKDKHKTNVTFYIEKEKNKDVPYPSVFAVFIDINQGRENSPDDTKLGYEHIGQHTPISLEYVKEKCRLATKEEYTDLANELENVIGYNLNIK